MIDPEQHTLSVPFVHALGAEWVGHDAGHIGMRLPLAPAVSRGDGIDLRAVVALLDHAGGAAVHAGVPATATATLELRVDLLGTPAPGKDVLLQAAVPAQAHGSALVLGTACTASGHGQSEPPFARMTGRYIVGSGPGQGPADAAYLATRDAAVARYAGVGRSAAGSFDEMLGCRLAGDIWRMPFVDALVGSVTLPALHGGAVAAGLMTAAWHAAAVAPALQAAALTVRYLRAARAVETTFKARVVKAGSRALFAEAQALQGGQPVATLQALFG